MCVDARPPPETPLPALAPLFPAAGRARRAASLEARLAALRSGAVEERGLDAAAALRGGAGAALLRCYARWALGPCEGAGAQATLRRSG